MSLLDRASEKLNDLRNFRKDFLFVTLDSLRFDVAARAMEEGSTPVLQSLVGRWEKREAAATYTLPSHVSMFSGMMPRLPRSHDGKQKESRLFALSTSWERYRGRNIKYFFDDVANVPKGFESRGYQTIGVGGVGWFSNQVQASSFWKDRYFQHFLYKPSYGEEHANAFPEQIADLAALISSLPESRRFVFINVSSTHRPYSNGDGESTIKSQQLCLEFVDRHLPSLLETFKSGAVGVICGDHGDCMGEDGLWGHGFVHEKIWNVPYAEFEF